MAQACRSNPKYVYELPYFERMELCRILDQNDKWEELGGIYMHFDVLTIQTLRKEVFRGNSPSDELLTKWGHQNHTILELFVLLSKMQHYQAMLIIKQFVDPEYHKLIYEGEQNLSRLFKCRVSNRCHERTEFGSAQVARSADLGPGSESVRRRRESNLNSSQKSDSAGNKISFAHEQDAGNNERKILNNETVFQPGRRKQNENGDAQTLLVNKGENAAGGDEANLLRPKVAKGDSAKDRNLSEISTIAAESVGILPVITFRELEIATNGWDQAAILGKGGFGTVYRGTWKNTQVAIKRTKNSDSDENRMSQIQQILGELKMLNSYRHDNILPLYGFSSHAEEPCLVYQYMPNGSLEDRLLCRQGTKPLTWLQRHNIATGTARGLQFLHTIGEKPLIHGDVKSANILLDSNFEPKIGDFGLAREGPYSHYTHVKVSKVHGTRPYLPDEFLRHKKFSTKVDTHSFGIVLFELATGLRAYDDQRHHKFLKELIENADEQELTYLTDKKCGPDEWQTFPHLIALGKRCASRKPKDRPEMVQVLQELNAVAVKIAKLQNVLKQSALSPYEKQILHDQLRMMSGSGSRAVSPFQVAYQASPDAHPPAFLNNPFYPSEQHRNDSQRGGHPANPIVQVTNPCADLRQAPPPPPVIAVSPPSAPATDSATSTQPEADPNEGFVDDYDYSSQFDNVLPLISELGIKAKSKKEEDVRSSRDESLTDDIPDIDTTTKGKRLWILDDPPPAVNDEH